MSYPKVEGYRIKCPQCLKFFVICTSCYRGHRYCSESCRTSARRGRSRARNLIYSKQPQAKKLHRLRQNRYRKKVLESKNVTDASSNPNLDDLKPSLPNWIEHQVDSLPKAPGRKCLCCGREVAFIRSLEIFVRRRMYDDSC